MKNCFFLAATLVLALPAPAQNTPRGEKKQAKADRRMERAHTIKHGESISKKPKLIRQENKVDDKKTGRPKFKR